MHWLLSFTIRIYGLHNVWTQSNLDPNGLLPVSCIILTTISPAQTGSTRGGTKKTGRDARLTNEVYTNYKVIVRYMMCTFVNAYIDVRHKGLCSTPCPSGT